MSKDPHPARARVLREVLLPPRQRRIPRLRHRRREVEVYICYDRHFPEGWRALGLTGADAEIVFNPSATSRGLSNYLWKLEQPASTVANEYYIGAINRVGIEDLGDDDFYGTSYFVDPEGSFVGGTASSYDAELVVPTWTCRCSRRCATAGRSTGTAVRTPTTT